MEELIKEIMSKAYQISTKTKADVFVSYSGHVNSVCVYLYKNGWRESLEWDFRLDFVLEPQKDTIAKLQLVLKELEEIEKGE